MNRKFTVPAAQPGHAFAPVRGQNLDHIFSVQHGRAVAKDNAVRLGDRTWQIERTPWRGTLAGCRVTICEHLEGDVSIVYGPHLVGRYTRHRVSRWDRSGRPPGTAGGLPKRASDQGLEH